MPNVTAQVDKDDSLEKFKQEREIKTPPQAGFIRFCPQCGHNDRIRPLLDRHFAGGKMCDGVPVELEYVLVDPERDHLEDKVIEAAKSLRQAILFPSADWPIEREMENFNSDVDRLLRFEGKQN